MKLLRNSQLFTFYFWCWIINFSIVQGQMYTSNERTNLKWMHTGFMPIKIWNFHVEFLMRQRFKNESYRVCTSINGSTFFQLKHLLLIHTSNSFKIFKFILKQTSSKMPINKMLRTDKNNSSISSAPSFRIENK